MVVHKANANAKIRWKGLLPEPKFKPISQIPIQNAINNRFDIEHSLNGLLLCNEENPNSKGQLSIENRWESFEINRQKIADAEVFGVSFPLFPFLFSLHPAFCQMHSLATLLPPLRYKSIYLCCSFSSSVGTVLRNNKIKSMMKLWCHVFSNLLRNKTFIQRI